MKVAIYARYSSDNQRDASIADQLRICRAHAEKQGWQLVEEYTDHAISGASLLRPGIQALIGDATRRRFQVVLAEAMDRLSRDQQDIAGLYKRMSYPDVKIVTLSEGEVSHLHVGLKGTMNALFLQDLDDKGEPSVALINTRRRPRYLFSGLTKCACCGGGYSAISATLIGCSTARNKGNCDNRVNIRRDELERRRMSCARWWRTSS